MASTGNLNFERLRQIPIEQVCGFLNLELTKKGARLLGPCPICESSRGFVVTPRVNRYWCFARCRNRSNSGGDVIDLVSVVRKVTLYEAACVLADNFNSS